MRVSYVGMTPQTVTITQGVIKVVLKSDAKSLDEVVVTAMGISREKKALGYAVQDVKSDQLTRAANTDLAGALQGKVSGVDIAPSSGMPGASSKITIRGSRSFTGDNTPLYVIDGMPISSAADVTTTDNANGAAYGTDYANRSVDIDPNDIESINILKGQAASALYGMRASNGVIVITTKSGKGVAKGKPTITFRSNLSFDVVSTLPELQNEFGQGSGGSYDPYSGHSWGSKIADLANDPTYGGNTDNAFTQKMGKRQGQYYVPQRAEAGLDPWATPKAYNNMKDFFDTGITWSNNVNVSQNLDKGNYSFSLGNSHQEGIIPTTGMDRYNAKMSAEVQLSPNFQDQKAVYRQLRRDGYHLQRSGELQHERNPLARRRRPVRAEHVPPGMDRRRLLGCGQQPVHRTLATFLRKRIREIHDQIRHGQPQTGREIPTR